MICADCGKERKEAYTFTRILTEHTAKGLREIERQKQTFCRKCGSLLLAQIENDRPSY